MVMKITGLDGKEHKFNYSKYHSRKFNKNKSKLHEIARDILRDIFPDYSIYEEVTLPGSKKPGRKGLLFADFYIPDLNLIVETHGRQHFEYSRHFHSSISSFYLAKQRDRDKIEWAELNGIDVVTLAYNEKEQWKNQILKVRPLQ